VVLNMSPNQQKVDFNLSNQGFAAKQATTLLTTTAAGSEQPIAGMVLPAYTVYIGELSK
jgi:hypothetical protein